MNANACMQLVNPFIGSGARKPPIVCRAEAIWLPEYRPAKSICVLYRGELDTGLRLQIAKYHKTPF